MSAMNPVGAGMNEHYDVSVIVPIYNVEEYLVESLDSLAAQRGVSIEVLLIDDGSTDKSGALAQKYAAAHEGFKYFYKENGGAGSARNYGLTLATGEFIAFADPDDLVDPNTYAWLINAARRDGSDIAICNAARLMTTTVWPSRLHQRLYHNLPSVTTMNESPRFVYDTTSWNKVYRRQFIEVSGVWYPEGIYYQDIPFTVTLSCKARQISVCNFVGYYWRVRESAELSATQRASSTRNLHDRFISMGLVDERLSECNVSDSVLRAWNVKKLDSDLMVFVNQIPKVDEETAHLYMESVNTYLDAHPDLWTCVGELSPLYRARYECVRSRDVEGLRDLVEGKDIFASLPVTERGGRLYMRLANGKDADVTGDIVEASPHTALSYCGIKPGVITLNGGLWWRRVNMGFGEQGFTATLVHVESGVKIALLVEPYRPGWMRGLVGTVANMSGDGIAHYDCDGCGFKITIDEEKLASAAELPDGIWHVLVGYSNRFGEGEVVLANPRGKANSREGRADMVAGRRVALRYSRAHEVELHITTPQAMVEGVRCVASRMMLSTFKGAPGLVLQPSPAWGGQVIPLKPMLGIDVSKLTPNVTYSLVAGSDVDKGLVASKEKFAQFHSLHNRALMVVSLRDSVVHARMFDGPACVVTNKRRKEDELVLDLKIVGVAVSRIRKTSAELCAYDATSASFVVLAECVLRGAKGEIALSFEDEGVLDSIGFDVCDLVVRLRAGSNAKTIEAPVYAECGMRETFVFPDATIIVERAIVDARLRLRTNRVWPKDRPAPSVRKRDAMRAYERALSEPLDVRTVLFESNRGGRFGGDPRALYEHLAKNDAELSFVWSMYNDRKVLHAGANSVLKDSIDYYRCLATAGYVITDCVLPKQFKLREGQTWLYFPPFESGTGMGDGTEEFPTYIVSRVASETEDSNAQGSSRILQTGLPHTDAVARLDEAKQREARECLRVPAGKHVLLYLPTKCGSNTLAHAYQNGAFSDIFGSDWVVLVRRAGGVPITIASNMKDVSAYEPMSDLYAAADVLLTDSDSYAQDFTLVDKDLLYFDGGIRQTQAQGQINAFRDSCRRIEELVFYRGRQA